jgi:iron complex outermembrane receptor protein
MTKLGFFGAGSALALAAGLWAPQALAAEATQPSAVAEITVVAQKREEKIQTVPVAISAFTAKHREILGIKTVQDISDFTPGLSYFNQADRAYIRGIGRNTVNLAIASGVATYYDGVYYGANATIALAKDSLFIGNIEVDRGPQNTLHGSNSDGGTINYISKRPTKSFYAEARAGAADYGYYYGEGVVSGPLTDNWRFRAGGSYASQNGGFYHNFDGKPEGGYGPQGSGGKWYYAEAQLEGNIGDHLDVWGKVSSADYDTDFHQVAIQGNIPEYEFGGGQLAPTGFYGLCALDGNTGVGCLLPGQSTGDPGTVVPGSAHGYPVLANQFPGNNPSTANPHEMIGTFDNHNTQNRDLALATIWTYHFPSFDVSYTGGYQSFYYNLNFGPGADSGLSSYQVFGASPLGAFIGCNFVLAVPAGQVPACEAAAQAPLTIKPAGEHILFIEEDQYFSHELNIASTGSGPFQYLAGLYWYHEHFDQPVGLQCYRDQQQLFHPISLEFTPAPLNGDGCAVNVDGNITYNSYAGFVQGSYKINDQWKLQGGVRYTFDHKAGFEQQRIVLFNVPGTIDATLLGSLTPGFDVTPTVLPAPGGPGAGVAFVNPATGNAVRSLGASWDAWTGDAEVDFTPEANTLTYFRYARGYKAGGFNAGSLSFNPETQSEYVDSFELGLKKTFGTVFQLNGAAFFYNFLNDQQPFTVIEPSGNQLTEIFNIPSVHTYGVELEGVWHPIDPLTFTMDYSYLSAKVHDMKGNCVVDAQDPLAELPGANTTGCPPGGAQNITGATLPEAPPNKVALNALYAWKMDPGTLTFSLSFVWKDKTYGDIFNRPLQLAPSYYVMNFRATWDDAKDRYTVTAFVNNFTNQLGFDNVTETNQSIPGFPLAELRNTGIIAPLTFGGEFQLRFH